MKKFKKEKIFALIILLFLCCIPKNAFGETKVFNMEGTGNMDLEQYEELGDAELSEKLKSMTSDDLNALIDAVMQDQQTNTRKKGGSIRLAWLAAAEIARKKGYNCAATIVEHSVKNIRYDENSIITEDGIFYKKIKGNANFKTYMNKNKNKEKPEKSFAFEKSANKDLFYALHNVDISIRKNAVLNFYSVVITDTFDFDYDNEYKSLFTSCVNNIGWLSQQTHILNKIPISISFYYKEPEPSKNYK